jgi:hypothetical protein
MTQSIVQDRTARRVTKAAGIVTRQECEPQDNGGWNVRDTGTGSGTWHQTTGTTCSCADFTYRRLPCKHISAVQREERSLAQYCADWDSRSEQAQQSVLIGRSHSPHCPDCNAPSNTSPITSAAVG